MLYRIKILPTAEESLAALPKKHQAQIARRIDALAENPHPPWSKALKGEKGFFRIRSGDYRIVCQMEEEVLLIIVVKIGHRREIYR